jgi:hypothetical protein
MRRAFLPIAVCVAAGIAVLGDVHAAPLDADACAKLKVERDGLEQAGVRGNMAKGPQWAKANLPADKLDQIRRLLELEGQLLFRCSGQRLIELPASVEADPAAAAPEEGTEDGKAPAEKNEAAHPGGEKKALAKAAKPEDKAAPGDAAKTQAPSAKRGRKRAPDKAGEEPPTKSAAKVKPKTKAKTDDAFKPPPSDPANPFPNAPQNSAQ